MSSPRPSRPAPNPDLSIDDSPFYLSTIARPWARAGGQPRRASLSSFGFGGSNFHAALEEYVPAGGGRSAALSRTASHELILLSADDPKQLPVRGKDLLGRGPLHEVAQASQRDFDVTAKARLALVAADPADLENRLGQAVETISAHPDRCFSGAGGISYEYGEAAPGPIAFLFPGQGSQYPGMGAEVAMAFPAAQAVWDRAAGLEFALHEVVFPKPSFDSAADQTHHDTLIDTRWAQPALAAHSLSLLAVVGELGIRPERVAGHSLGELVALHAAGVFGEADLLRLTRRRGELMADAAGVPCAMLAVTATSERVKAAIAESSLEDVWLANHNQPDQAVVSGTVQSVAALEETLAARGITCRRLLVSTAFHSPLVAAASTPLRAFLDELNVAAPGLEVYGNTDADPYPAAASEIRGRVALQLAAPVRFVEQIQAMYAAGTRTFIEVGAGAAVTGMVGAILGDRPHLAVNLDRKGQDGLHALFAGLGRLAVHGVAMDTEAMWNSYTPDADPEPAAKPTMTIPLNGAAYGHRYPPADGVLPAPVPDRPLALSLPAPASEPMTERVTAAMESHEPAQNVPQDDRWLQIVAAAQQQTAEAHASFQQALLASHQAFLQMAENSLSRLAGTAMPSSALPVPVTSAPVQARELAPAVVPAPAAAAPPDLASAPAVASPPAHAPAVEPGRAAPLAADVGASSGLSLEILLDVVAEKTGYPVELLGGDMDLESELGVDSIKKVQILSAVRQRAPGLPEPDSPEMAELFKLRTLSAIVEKASELREVVHMGTQAPQAETAQMARAPMIRRLAVRSCPAPACGLAMTGLSAAPVLVVDGGSGLAEAVAANLNAAGVAAKATSRAPEAAASLIYLGGLKAIGGADDGVSVLREAFRWARAVAPALERDGGVFVTVQDTGGDFGLSRADGMRTWLGGLAGLTRTAGREWPAASVKAIDCECGYRAPAAVADAIVAELLTGGPTVDVGLAADGVRRTVQLVEEQAKAAQRHPVGPESVIVASGGARGVTAAAVRELAAARPRIAIFGRTELEDEPDGLAAAATEAALIRVLAAQGRAGTAPTRAHLPGEGSAGRPRGQAEPG